MPIAPTFAPSLADLQSSLRLSAVTNGDALKMIEDAVREVRLGFIRRLGKAAVDALLLVVYDPASGPPTNNDQNRREVANLAEIAWVKMLLLQRLPTIFRDSSGDAALSWQTDGLTREAAEDQRRALITQLHDQIEESFEMLQGDDEEDAATFSATTFEPVDPPIMGGSSKDPSGQFQLGD